ncbi:MAG: dTDP-4-dehydrorhamnose reductase family protein [Vicinamibacterales bacterium]
MSRQRVLILGATGMLGHKLCEVLGGTPELEVHATTRGGPGEVVAHGIELHAGIDLSGGTARLATLLDRLVPDVVVNAVGAIKQKDLRAAIDETFFVNATLPHELALLNPNAGGRVVHFSTDCVFRGDRGAYRESDSPDVTDLYGRSKAVGEIAYGPHLTLRTSIVGFERQGHLGLLSWFVSHAPGTTVRGYTGAIYGGLPTVTLARTVRELLLRREPLRGLYHVASDPISKYDLLVRLNEALGLDIRVEPDHTVHIDRSLDDARFRGATGSPRPSWSTLVADLKQDYLEQDYEAVYRARRRAQAEDACSR